MEASRHRQRPAESYCTFWDVPAAGPSAPAPVLDNAYETFVTLTEGQAPEAAPSIVNQD